LLELDHTLVLVDTGLGLNDVRDPKARIHPFFLRMLNPELREEMTAVRQIEQLGFDPRDVRHIVLTHLDFDHAGGLDDFPHATVHLLGAERDAALARSTLLDHMRYRPQQWSTQANWRTYAEASGGERWFGFDCIRGLEGLPPEISLVPLPGHTLGHTGVAVDQGKQWLLHAGDAYFFYAEMDAVPYCIPGLRLYQSMMEKDRTLRLRNQARLRELKQTHGTEVQIFCAHDEVEFERLANHSARESAAAPRVSQIEQLMPHEYARKSEPPPRLVQRLLASAGAHRSAMR
jgi:glyoxylase-like metal-dependent hydrolase (beta-lactamase superfamily II)